MSWLPPRLTAPSAWQSCRVRHTVARKPSTSTRNSNPGKRHLCTVARNGWAVSASHRALPSQAQNRRVRVPNRRPQALDLRAGAETLDRRCPSLAIARVFALRPAVLPWRLAVLRLRPEVARRRPAVFPLRLGVLPRRAKVSTLRREFSRRQRTAFQRQSRGAGVAGASCHAGLADIGAVYEPIGCSSSGRTQRALSSCTASTSAATCSGCMSGDRPWPRLNTWPSREPPLPAA